MVFFHASENFVLGVNTYVFGHATKFLRADVSQRHCLKKEKQLNSYSEVFSSSFKPSD